MKPNDKIEFDGKTYVVVDASELNPAQICKHCDLSREACAALASQLCVRSTNPDKVRCCAKEE